MLTFYVFKGGKTSGVPSTWIVQHFSICLLGAGDGIVQRYARVWLWHFVASFLFPHASRNTASWVVLPILMQPLENIALYSWGNTVLAWTYRQLCVAYCRSTGNANLCGCAYLLQVWCWERWPVGRPTLCGLPVSTLKCNAGSSV